MVQNRQKLRNGTWIIPRTGERTRRQFTWRRPSLENSGDENDLHHLAEGETIKEKLLNLWCNVKIIFTSIWAWLKSPKGQGTVKCSIAYLIASMGTFYKPAAQFLGDMDGKHIVATITVYFHPARSLGSQVEAVAIAVFAVCYAMLIGTLSMGTSVLIGSKWDQVELSYAVILIVFVGGGLGFLGWVKQKLNNPLVSVGVSIASIGIITILTKENSVHTGVFSNHKIIQSLKMLLMATTTSTVVNIVFWPVSARHALRKSMRTASTSLGDMLTMISHGFLSGNEEEFTSKSFTKASSGYSSTLAQLNKNARESKYEYYLLGREQIYKHDKAVVKSMESLAQSLGGLRSAANTQFELLKEISNTVDWKSSSIITFSPKASPRSSFTFPSSPRFSGNRFGTLSAIDEAPDERSDREDLATPAEEAPEFMTRSTSSLRSPPDIFELFIARLGPSMKSLVQTMAEILKEPPFNAPGAPITIPEQFKESLFEATSLYNQARATALEELYKTIEFGRTRPETVQADFEEVAAACGHFSFSLLSFADEMQKYLDALDNLKYMTEQNKRTWSWLKLWKQIKLRSNKPKVEDPEQHSLLQPVRRMRQSKLPRGIPDTMRKQRDSYAWEIARSDESWKNKAVRVLSQDLLGFFRFLTRDDSTYLSLRFDIM